jgi:hypothetical protein
MKLKHLHKIAFLEGVTFTFALFLGVLLLGVGRVAAVGSSAPDNNDYTDGSKVYLEVSDAGATNGLDAPTSAVTIYSKISNPIVTIYNPNHCTSSIDSADNTGGYDTTFVFGGADQSYPTGSSNGGKNTFSCSGNTWTTQLIGLY